MSNIKNFLTAGQAKKIAYESEKALNRVFKQIKVEAENGNNFTDIDMSRLSTRVKAKICDELVNAGYTTYPLCEFHGTGADGIRVYWENIDISDYSFNDEYFLKNAFNAEIAKNQSKYCIENFYLKNIMRCIREYSEMGKNSCMYQIDTRICNENKCLKEKLKNMLIEKGFKANFKDNILLICW